MQPHPLAFGTPPLSVADKPCAFGVRCAQIKQAKQFSAAGKKREVRATRGPHTALRRGTARDAP